MLFSIKNKLILGLSTIVILMIFSAIAGLYSVISLENQINKITDEAGPIVEETDDLIATLWESAKVANEILASENISEINILSEELDQLNLAFDATAKTLMLLVNEPVSKELIDKALVEEREFGDNLAKMITAHKSELKEELKAKKLLSMFDSQGQDLIQKLEKVANANEAEMAKAEDQGDQIAERSGTAKEVNAVLGELFERDYPVVEASLKLQRVVLEIQDTSGEYLAGESPELLPPIQKNFDELIQSTIPYFEILSKLAESETDRQDLISLDKAFKEWVSLAVSDEKLFDSHRDQLAQEYQADKFTELLEKDVDNADASLEKVAFAFDAFMDGADEAAEASVSQSINIQIGSVVLILLVSLFLMVICIKIMINPIERLSQQLKNISEGDGDLTQRMDDTSNDELGELAKSFNVFVEQIQTIIAKILSASSQMSVSTKEMNLVISSSAKNLVSQNQETESVAAATEELSANAEEINSSIIIVLESSTNANQKSSEAKLVVNKSISSIKALALDIESSSQIINQLSDETDNIGSVLTTIRSIADQTNLLALNAAIEAARAGEQGRGFSVVADEVRTLAARTQSSTSEIQEMIERLQFGVQKAVETMKISQDKSEQSVLNAVSTGDLLDSIAMAGNEVDNMMSQISSSITEQSNVTVDINKSILKIAESAKDASEEIVLAENHSNSLSDLSKSLNELVKQFQV